MSEPSNVTNNCGEQMSDTSSNVLKQTSTRLLHPDYDVPCFLLAKKLLGLQLCRRLDSGEIIKGTIVETESYPGGEDKASMSFGGKKTDRNAPMFMSPGTAFVHISFGMYHCFNISSQGEGAAVLIRAVEPTYGMKDMKQNREKCYNGKKQKKKKKYYTALDICNGPSKVCMSFAIDKSLNKEDMVQSRRLWIEWPYTSQSETVKDIVACARIGIDSVEFEWASKPYRFYINGNPYVSKRDKVAERNSVLQN